ncbi:hypothetical protein DFJ74DRAFT_648498 [Hyaloraphidium curvatum]|nr:hypothetical protein DFJ74DRAFT_648498 [Hyaloraphidium curvatum]
MALISRDYDNDDKQIQRHLMKLGSGDGCISDSCEQCGTESDDLRRCSGCKVTRYCGAACQRAAWKEHKDNCRQWP